MLNIFKKRFKFWQYLTNFWSVVFFVTIIYDFVFNNAAADSLEIIAFIYVSTLAVYVGNKEFERWYHRHEERHPGEIFVLLWTLLIFALLALTLIFHKSYRLPSAVISSYIAVLTILAITEQSKSLHRRRRSR
jgi:uncharacterized membrane protein YhaH (DUF805 family)